MRGASGREAVAPKPPEAEAPDPDTLYTEGMAYYRRRRWREARQRFEQVKALQPNSRGIDALLRELDIFMQLESVEAGEADSSAEAAHDQPAFEPDDGLDDLASLTARPSPPSPPAARRRGSAATLAIVAVVALLVVGAVYLASSGRLAFISGNQGEASLRNLGQAYLIAQQYDKALGVYSRLLTMLPDDPEVLNGFEKAKEGLYQEGMAYEKAGEFATALERYLPISRVDPEHRDVRARIARLQLRLQLDERYREAEEHLARQAYGDAEKVLLWIRGQDAEYRPGAVSDGLYEVYVGRGQRAIDWVAQELQPAANAPLEAPQYAVKDEMLARVREAIRDFERAAAERRGFPSGDAATPSEAELAASQATRLHEGLERYNDWAWADTIVVLEPVYAQDAAYLSGKLALVLCDAHLHLGDAYLRGGEYMAAVSEFQSMQQMPACDQRVAEERAQLAGAPLTPTATATPTPRPTNTPTPRPTMTPEPTSTPSPEPPPAQPSSGGGGSSSGGGSSKPEPTPPKPEATPTPKSRK